MAEWISVKERLPEDDLSIKKNVGAALGCLTVLVYNGVVKQTNRYFCEESKLGLLPKTEGWEWASSNVTHWMPLPEPPKEAAHD